MEEKKSGNGQTGKENGRKPGKEKSGNKILSKLVPLINLWPAVLVVVLISGMLPVTNPVLREIPELLTIDAKASVKAETETETETESAAKGNFEDGVYQGTGTGYGGTITVEVTVEDGSIVSVEILSAPGETASFFNRAKAVIDSVIQFQTWEVDAVSGATYSSKGILAAIQNALTGEKVETETAPVAETEPLVEEIFEEPDGYKDGTYYGSARGFGGTIQVKVVISEGKITGISIVSASGETSSYLASAKAVISRILSAQSPNVDVVSGATYSSNGIINAVKSALRQAAGSNVSDDLSEDETAAQNSNGSDSSSSRENVIAKPVVSRDGYVDGVYEGTAEGFGGDITVQVMISDGKIASITIISAEDETPSYLSQAKAVIERIIKAQSTAVDVVSGATYSSTGIINATAEALNKALPAGNEEKPGVPENSEPDNSNSNNNSDNITDSNNQTGENTAKYRDGIYQGEALCDDEDTFTYTVRANVTINDGSITEIRVEKINDLSDYPEDNDTYLDNAVNGNTRRGIWYEGVVSQIITSQSTENVDVVSGATYSSNAVTEAVKNALSQAAVEETPEESSDQESSEEESEVPSCEESNSQESSGDDSTAAPSESDNTDNGTDDNTIRYTDGIYQADALCEDEDMFTYIVRTSITIEDGIITEVAVEKINDNSEYPESNDIYLDYAINGRTLKGVVYEGVVNQILNNQSADNVDAVSGATYSSNAITEAAKNTLEQAVMNQETEPAAVEQVVVEEETVIEEGAAAGKESPVVSILDYMVMAWNDFFDNLTERKFRV